MLELHWTLYAIAAGVAWATLAYWRPGSVALALSWVIAQVWWLYTGEYLPFGLYRVLDVMVIAAMFIQSRHVLDWLILAIFPVQWLAYNWQDEVSAWWFLWALALVQMILAGPWPARRKIGGAFKSAPRRHYAGE